MAATAQSVRLAQMSCAAIVVSLIEMCSSTMRCDSLCFVCLSVCSGSLAWLLALFNQPNRGPNTSPSFSPLVDSSTPASLAQTEQCSAAHRQREEASFHSHTHLHSPPPPEAAQTQTQTPRLSLFPSSSSAASAPLAFVAAPAPAPLPASRPAPFAYLESQLSGAPRA